METIIREELLIERELAVLIVSHGTNDLSNKELKAFGAASELEARRKIQEHETAAASLD